MAVPHQSFPLRSLVFITVVIGAGPAAFAYAAGWSRAGASTWGRLIRTRRMRAPGYEAWNMISTPDDRNGTAP